MKKVLVTGGLGFIGSNLVDYLLKKDYCITIVDNLQSNAVDKSFYEKKCKVVISNIEDYETSESFDYIYHLASVVGPAGVLQYAGKIGLSMVRGMMKVIDIALECDSVLVDVSTSEVYGKDGYLSEDDDKIVKSKVSVRLEYGIGKLLTEIILENTSKIQNINYNIIRPFNVAGPRQQPRGGFVTPIFIQQALSKNIMTIFAGGKQKRCFTHVDDIVEGIYLASQGKTVHEVFNIGNKNNEITIEDYAKLIKKLTFSNSELLYLDGKEIYGNLYEEAFDKMPISDKAEKLLSWEPKKNLETIIYDYISYFKNEISSQSI